MGKDRLTKLCTVHELNDRAARGFDLLGEGRDQLFIVRRGATFKAYHNVCPHRGSSMPWRKDAYLNADGTRIVRHAHGAMFDIDTGNCILGPALGTSLEPVPLAVADDGTITALVPCKSENPGS